jgi:hypothetical protein
MDYLKENQWQAVDGIVDEKIYESQRPKILWVLREPNGEGFDFMDYLKDVTAYPKWKQSYGLVVKISRIILEGHIDDPKEWGIYCPEIMHRIALINIKKTGGGSTVNWNALNQAFSENKGMLRDQIQEIDPDYIFCGGTYDYVKELRLHYPLISLPHPGQTSMTHNDYIKSALDQYEAQ